MTALHATQRKAEQPLMPDPELFRIIRDPRGPETTISSLSDLELARLLDALYQNLDTPRPEPTAIFWYETGVGESLSRANISRFPTPD
ncbi:hypothetical protein ACFVYC_09805 [Pseudarthrobacter sp. NPDC058329]|uniref:hypothetical protein n=1 Tax=Pseudarthrobacter sp. NPDC058329 TaxID=3346448 RepID=UPI0036D79B83